jgi:hypothetical protein
MIIVFEKQKMHNSWKSGQHLERRQVFLEEEAGGGVLKT